MDCPTCNKTGHDPQCPECQGSGKQLCTSCGTNGKIDFEQSLRQLKIVANLFDRTGYGPRLDVTEPFTVLSMSEVETKILRTGPKKEMTLRVFDESVQVEMVGLSLIVHAVGPQKYVLVRSTRSGTDDAGR